MSKIIDCGIEEYPSNNSGIVDEISSTINETEIFEDIDESVNETEIFGNIGESVSETTKDISETTGDISETTKDISETTGDISETTKDISETTGDISVGNLLLNPRIKLIAKPAQSGKTAIIIEMIKKQFGIEDIVGGFKTINIIFNANNLLLTKQTGTRFKKDIDCILHNVVEFSSRTTSDARSWRELIGYIIDDASNIMVCNNKQRVTDIIKVVKKLMEMKNDQYRFNIWIDEADKFINSIKKLQDLVNNNRVNLWYITATPAKLFTKLGNQNVYKLQNTTSDNYHGWKDNNVTIFSPAENQVEFVHNVFNKICGTIQPLIPKKLNLKQQKLLNIIKREIGPSQIIKRSHIITFKDELGLVSKTPGQSISVLLQNLRDKNYINFLKSGIYNLYVPHPIEISNTGNTYSIDKNTRWFIPGNTKKSSHYSIKEACIGRGFAVFVVNGDGVELTLPDKTTIGPVPKINELHITIKELTDKYELWNYPVAITGNICISRGISIQTPNWMFTNGIVSGCSNNSELSQIAGRFNGNIKNWKNWSAKLPIVYTTQKFNDIAIDEENKSRKLAEMAWVKGGEQDISQITNKEFNKLSKMPYPKKRIISNNNKSWKVFKIKNNIKKFCFKYFEKKISPSNQAPKVMRDNAGINPSINYIINRWWGMGTSIYVRCIATNENEWVVYWNKLNYPNVPRDNL